MLQRLTSGYIALLLTVFLLAFPPGGYGAIGEFTYRLFLLLCGGYVVAVLVLRTQLALIGTQPIGNVGARIKAAPLSVKFLFAFLLFIIISALLSPYPGTFRGAFRQEGVLTVAIYILSTVFVAKYIRPQKWMLYLLGIGMGLVSILSLIQLTGANPFALYPEGHNYYGAGIYYSGAYLGTLGNVGFTAAFLCIGVGVLSMALIKFDTRKDWLLAIPLFLAVFLIFVMGVDAAFVALAAGMVLMFPVAVTSGNTLTRTLLILAVVAAAFGLSQVLVFQDGPILFVPPRLLVIVATICLLLLVVFVMIKHGTFSTIPAKWYRIGATIVALGAICAVFAYLWFYNGPEHGMVWEASEILHGRWDDTFGTRRVYIWRHVWEGIRPGTLLFGTGPDTLGFWPIEPFRRYILEIGREVVSGIDAAHNEYLHILVTNGLLALLAYFGALVTAAVSWVRQPDNHLSAMAGAGMLFYAIQALFGISMSIAAPFFWTCFAVLIYANRQNLKEKLKK
ncbi:MAG: O-antigen ligase family protein [Oscillospiraceae bacterium]|nr:O-antigen ligase family protein [Oscillospiraceae bacterium]